MGKDRAIMTCVKELNILEDYELICKRITELKEGSFKIRVSSDAEVVDKVMSLIALANTKHIQSKLYWNVFIRDYTLAFYKNEKNRT